MRNIAEFQEEIFTKKGMGMIDGCKACSSILGDLPDQEVIKLYQEISDLLGGKTTDVVIPVLAFLLLAAMGQLDDELNKNMEVL